MATFLITLCDSSQFELTGICWTLVAIEASIIRHRDYGSVPIYSVIRL
jgi:hypothetical protein